MIGNAARKVMAGCARRIPPFRGKERLFRALDRALRAFSESELEVEVGRVNFRVQTRELIEFRVTYLGAHEPQVLDAVSASLARSTQPVLWDVGANVGAISLIAARRVDAARVCAFEASPVAGGRLVENLHRNPDLNRRISLYPIALGDRYGVVDFFASLYAQNRGNSALSGFNDPTAITLKTMMTTGDALIASGAAPRPTTVKIDVEGFELEVLKGLEQTLRSEPPVEVVFEHSTYHVRALKRDPQEVGRLLQSFGYELRVVGADPESAVLAVERFVREDFDVLAVRRTNEVRSGWPVRKTS